MLSLPSQRTAKETSENAATLCSTAQLRVPEAPEDEHLLCFLLLRKIVGIVFSPVFSEGLCSLLKLLIAEHHSKFVSIYGVEACIPKMHEQLDFEKSLSTVQGLEHTIHAVVGRKRWM